MVDKPDDFTTIDMRNNLSYKLSELSVANNNLPFQEADFSETQTDTTKAKEIFAHLLEQPTAQGYKTQKQKIKDSELK